MGKFATDAMFLKVGYFSMHERYDTNGLGIVVIAISNNLGMQKDTLV